MWFKIAFGVAFAVAAIVASKTARSVGLYDNHALISRGPYRRIRHPIYLAFISIMLLILVLAANWVLGVSGLLLVTSIAVVRIPIEERQLHVRFGAAWESYRAGTGIMLPHVAR